MPSRDNKLSRLAWWTSRWRFSATVWAADASAVLERIRRRYRDLVRPAIVGDQVLLADQACPITRRVTAVDASIETQAGVRRSNPRCHGAGPSAVLQMLSHHRSEPLHSLQHRVAMVLTPSPVRQHGVAHLASAGA